MSEVGDVPPVQPTWPTRPTDKVEKGKRTPDSSTQNKKQPNEKRKQDDDGKPHVDEFA